MATTGSKRAAMKTADYFAERAKQGDVNAALKFLSRKGGIAPEDDDVFVRLSLQTACDLKLAQIEMKDALKDVRLLAVS